MANDTATPQMTLQRCMKRLVGAKIVRPLFWLPLFYFCVALAEPALSQQRPERVALVIGNAIYRDSAARAPTSVNDARMLANEFRRASFVVEFEENLNEEQMRRAIAAFVAKINPNTTALFYFSGLAVQSVRTTYLLPVDFQAQTEQDVWHHGIDVDALLNEVSRAGAKAKILIIDAARKNPYELRFRTTSDGLAPSVGSAGTLALYSTAPGMVLPDGNAAQSLFATALIEQLRAPNIGGEEAFNRARIAVSRASNATQVPLVASTLTDEFSFTATQARVTVQPSSPAAPPPAAARPPSAPSRTPPVQNIAPPAPPPPPRASEPPAASEPQPATAAQAPTDPGSVFRDCPDCPELVVAPSGTFEMGSAATEYSKPIHRVTIAKAFAIGRFEVTFKEWDNCVQDRGCKRRPDDRGWGRANRPVMNVSWLDAKEYTAWLSKKTGQTYRLPSEAEWEYTARAGTRTPFWWGQNLGERQANCRECRTGQTERSMPVGTYKPNAFGLSDTAGNVAEWVEDCWNDDYRGAPADGSAWKSGQCRLRVLRGGSYDSQGAYLQSDARFRYDSDVPYSANGFRVVREMR